jgi:NAD(P)-dependent dehydrogenase (short-subunit alcohol dehydrogenase family)
MMVFLVLPQGVPPMAVSLTGKVALITGVTSPVGQRIAETFAAAGASLILFARRQSDCAALEARIQPAGATILTLPCDLRSEDEVIRMVHRSANKFGRIDILVNAAAIHGPRETIEDYPIDPWRNVLATNVTGPYLVCREVLPWMTRQGSGSIINVTSSLTTKARPQWGAYLVSNHAIEGLTQVLAAELKGTGVRVNTVDVGLPQSDGTVASPEDAWTSVFLWLASDDSTAHSKRIIAADFALPTVAS